MLLVREWNFKVNVFIALKHLLLIHYLGINVLIASCFGLGIKGFNAILISDNWIVLYLILLLLLLMLNLTRVERVVKLGLFILLELI